MSTLTQFLGGKPRRQIVTLTASNASLPIPSWAQGGKGIVYVTGCGGGAGGATSNTSGQRGTGGQAGGFAVKHPIVIPSGVTTCSATIAAGGAGATTSSGSAVVGGNGGVTTLTIGPSILRMEGGNGGAGAGIGSAQGYAYMGDATVAGNIAVGGSPFGSISASALLTGFTSSPSTLGFGVAGGSGAQTAAGFGAGGHSLFGAGGGGVASVPANTNVNGANASGYGAGGAGACSINAGTVTAGNGSPGLLILEFVEGF